MKAPPRKCTGGTEPFCGKPATVCCALYADNGPPLEWFACDDPRHHAGAATTPIAQWFARINASTEDYGAK